MQRLHAAVEHLGEAGVAADLGDREARLAQALGGAAGRQELDAAAPPGRLREFDEAGFVGNADSRRLRDPEADHRSQTPPTQTQLVP